MTTKLAIVFAVLGAGMLSITPAAALPLSSSTAEAVNQAAERSATRNDVRYKRRFKRHRKFRRFNGARRFGTFHPRAFYKRRHFGYFSRPYGHHHAYRSPYSRRFVY